MLIVLKGNYLEQKSCNALCVYSRSKRKIFDENSIRNGKKHWEHTTVRSLTLHVKWNSII